MKNLNNTAILTTLSIIFLINIGCSSDDSEGKVDPVIELGGIEGCINPLAPNYNPDAEVDDGSCAAVDCSVCDHFISGTEFGFDGEEKGVLPGDVICLNAATVYEKPIELKNVRGTAADPILIINCGGKAVVEMPGRTYVMKAINSQYVRITGTGDPAEKYGISLSQANNLGLQMDYLSSNFEIDHVEVFDVGFAGIMAKTDPSCDEATQRGNYTMTEISIHDNYVHDTGGEGLYIGNSFYENGRNLDCGLVFPHDVTNVDIFRNKVKNTGWEGIQLGAAISGARVFDNSVENFGQADAGAQNNGIQIGEGTGGLCYNNIVINGPGSGIIVLGFGDNIVFNNVIIDPGKNGIFCDSRFTPGEGFNFINNTILNPGLDGININASELTLNSLINNIIVNPGNFEIYENDNTSKTGEDAYINAANPNVNIAGNFFTRDINEVGFVGISTNNFDINANSPVIDQGEDVSSFNITFDFLNNPRPVNEEYDIGAFEKQQ